MDEVFARRDLIDPAELRRLCEPSDRAGFMQLGAHLALIALAAVALHATLGTVWVVLPFLALGVLLFGTEGATDPELYRRLVGEMA